MAGTMSGQEPADRGKIGTVEQYIAAQPDTVQPILTKMRQTIRAAAPEAKERIAWHMPTYCQGRDLINFAAFAHHVSIFPGAEAITVFADKLAGYTTGKGTVQFQLDEPIPYDLIGEITRWRVAATNPLSTMKN